MSPEQYENLLVGAILYLIFILPIIVSISLVTCELYIIRFFEKDGHNEKQLTLKNNTPQYISRLLYYTEKEFKNGKITKWGSYFRRIQFVLFGVFPIFVQFYQLNIERSKSGNVAIPGLYIISYAVSIYMAFKIDLLFKRYTKI